MRQFHWIVLLAFLALSGCSSLSEQEQQSQQAQDAAPANPPDLSEIADAVPKHEPFSKYGNPKSYRVHGKEYRTLKDNKGFSERGLASWYGKKFHGRRTSSGETYDMYAMTAAHKHLPLPTYVQVTNLQNGKQIVVKVNDRGPFHKGRIIDLSYAAATKLGILKKGTAPVEIVAINPDSQTFVQVGAFSKQENAEQLQTKLQQQLKRPIRIQQANKAGKSFFRVQVGPLSSPMHLEQVTTRIAQLGIAPVQILTE